MTNSSLSSHRTPAAGAHGERGFALLTVIVIVMALTILGLSLFSLSGFEAQFFRPTLDQAQAMQSTRGGVEWARYVLQSTDSLDVVRTAARPPGVTGVVARAARYDGDTFDTADSTGSVFVDPPRPVWVRAVGSMGGQQGAVLAKFNPSPGVDLYKRLMTVMDSLVIKGPVTSDRFGNTGLYGNIRMGMMVVKEYDGTPIIPTNVKGTNCIAQQSFPRPGLDLTGTWWQQKYAGAAYLAPSGGMSLGSNGSVRIYRTDPGDETGNRRWSVILDTDAKCTLNVRGTSIWMFPEGLRCTQQLRFHKVGPDPATVILVSNPGAVSDPGQACPEEDVGFALLGGVGFDQDVNVFMVSSGGVEIEHVNDEVTGNGFASYLSIYSDWVRLMGPDLSGDMQLYHGNSCNAVPDPDRKNDVVDQLIEQDLLPNSRFARKRLEVVRGGWLESSATVGN